MQDQEEGCVHGGCDRVWGLLQNYARLHEEGVRVDLLREGELHRQVSHSGGNRGPDY